MPPPLASGRAAHRLPRLFEVLFQDGEGEVGQQGGEHPSNNLANILRDLAACTPTNAIS